MEKYLIILILLLNFILVFLSTGLAGEKRKTSRYEGVIQEVNLEEKTIIAGRENSNLAMLFGAGDATFKNIKGLQDLKVGDKVVVEYDAKLGKTIAVSVTKK